MGLMLFLITFLISIPFTFGVYKQRQNLAKIPMQSQIAEGDMFGDISGGGNQSLPQGIQCAAAGCYDQNGTPYYGGQQGTQNTTYPQQTYNPYGVQQQTQTYPLQTQQQLPQQNTTNAAVSAAGCTVADADFALDSEEQQLLTLINQYRQQHSLPALTISATLTKGAQWMADDMATSGNVNTHTDSLGRLYSGRAAACGYPASTTAVDIVLAASGTNAQGAFNGWIGSSSHQPVIVNTVSGITRNWQGIGIGKSNKGASPLTQRWVVMFGEANDGGVVPTIAPTAVPPTVTPPVTQPSVTVTVPPITTVSPGVTITTIPSVTTTPATGSGNFTVSFKMPGISSKNRYIVDKKIYGQVEVKKGESVISNNLYQFTFDPQTSLFTMPESPTLDVGSYNIRVRSTNSLWKDLGLIKISPDITTTVPVTTLIAGDLNSDNILNLTDYTILLSCYDPKYCMGKLNTDLNKDGRVNQQDLNIFYSNLTNREGD